MEEKELEIVKRHIEKAERDGFDRGMKTSLKELLKLMEEEKMTAVSYNSIRGIYDKYLEMNNLKD